MQAGSSIGSSSDKCTKSLLEGKKGLILGVANNNSLGWIIAKTAVAHGAEVALTYQNELFKKRVVPLAESISSKIVLPCDVACESEIDALFKNLDDQWGSLDFLVHAVAFSDKDELRGRYVETSQSNFRKTLDVSCFSFTALAKRAEKLMPNGGSLLTMSYYGAEKVFPHYNVMGVAKAALEISVKYLAADLGLQGIRVNAISAGPIKTLSASGIGDFRYILRWNQYNSPLRRNVTHEDIGNAALYLLSDLSQGVTGEIHHVDAGYNVVGMKVVDAPEVSVSG